MSNDSFVPANESMVSNSSFVLAMSQMTLTSYVATHNHKTVQSNRESVVYSPQSPQTTQPIVCETPSDAAFQPIDQNENTPNRSTSFAVVKSPTTPTSAGRVRKSMYLIDFTTPQVGAPSTTGSKSCGRNLLKSAIKNATHQSTATKKMNATIHTVSFDRNFVPETPKSAKSNRSHVFSSTPLMSAKASPKSIKVIPCGDQNLDESSGETIPTGNFCFFYFPFTEKNEVMVKSVSASMQLTFRYCTKRVCGDSVAVGVRTSAFLTACVRACVCVLVILY